MAFEFLLHNVTPLNKIFEILKSDDKIWQKNLIYISVSQLIAMIGMSSVMPFMPLYVRHLGITNLGEAQFWSGLIFAGPYFLSIITVPIWGALGDKYGRKLMIIRALIGLAIAMGLMGFARNVTELFTLRVVQGGVSGFIAANLAFVTLNTPKEKSGFAIGLLASATSAGNICGPIFGGIISDLIGMNYVFFVVSALCITSGILISINVVEKNKSKENRNGESLIQNFVQSIKLPNVSLLLFLIIISQAGIFFTNPIFPFFVEKIGCPPAILSTITGVLVGIIGVFNIFFAPRWGRITDKKDYRKVLGVCSLISGLALGLQFFATYYLYLIPFRVVAGIFISGIIPPLYSGLNKQAPDKYKGSIMGFASSATLFGSLFAYLTCGFTCIINIDGSLLYYIWCTSDNDNNAYKIIKKSTVGMKNIQIFFKSLIKILIFY